MMNSTAIRTWVSHFQLQAIMHYTTSTSKCTAPGIPKWSTILVLTRLDIGLDWKILHRNSPIGMQPRHRKGAGQVLTDPNAPLLGMRVMMNMDHFGFFFLNLYLKKEKKSLKIINIKCGLLFAPPPPPLTGHSIAIYYLFSLSMIEEMFFFYSIIFYILLLKSALNALNNTSLPSIRILLSKSSKKNEMEFKKKKNRPVADLSNECRHLYQDNLKEKKKWV